MADITPLEEKGAVESVFLENRGQLANDDIKYYTISSRMSIGFLSDGMIIVNGGEVADNGMAGYDGKELSFSPDPGEVYRVRFGGTGGVDPLGDNMADHRSNFFYGNDPDRWVTGVLGFTRLEYRNLWDGVDLVHELKGGHYTMALEGEGQMDPELQVERHILSEGWVSCEPKEVLDLLNFEEAGIDKFTVLPEGGTRVTIGEPLVFSTYLGGVGWDHSMQVDVDGSENAYIARYTESVNFPTTDGSYDEDFNGGDWDIFVSKMKQDGSTFGYSTFIGGYGGDVGMGIHADEAGNVYLTGYTDSPNFPTTPGAFDTMVDGIGHDAFILGLGPMGDTLSVSTLLGGNRTEAGTSIDVGPYGDIYIGGYTESQNFPTTSGALSEEYNGGTTDAFVTRIGPSGTSLKYSTYIGGYVFDEIWDIEVDLSGRAHVLGETASPDLPVTESAFDTVFNGGDQDLFVSVLDASGGSLVRSTFVGGSGAEYAMRLVLDGDGCAYLTGGTDSLDYPTTLNAYNRYNNGVIDAVLTKFTPSGNELVFSTYLGDDDFDGAYDIDIDEEGYIYMVGTTRSRLFPASDFGYDRTFNQGLSDAFICKFNQTGERLLYSTFFGGGEEDQGTGIACIGNSRVFVTGYTNSRDLPTTSGTFSESYNGGAFDGFLALFNLSMRPSKVEELTSAHGDEKVILSWKPPIDKGGPAPLMYRIYRGVVPGYMDEIALISETSFVDTGLTNGERYLHQIAVVNDLGQGPLSDYVTTRPRSIPDAPYNLSLERGNHKVMLRWNEPADTGGLRIKAYNIYRGTEADSLEYLIGLGEVLEHTDGGLENGITYYYQVSANNTEGEGPRGQVSSVVPAWTPSAPMKFSGEIGDRVVKLNWDGPEDDGGFEVLGYRIFKGVRGEGLEQMAVVDEGPIQDTDVVNGIMYNYSIVAFNEIGDGISSRTLNLMPATTPGPVRGLDLVPADGTVTVSWAPPEDDGGHGTIGYHVYRGRNLTNMRVMSGLLEGTTFVDRGLTNGQRYYYMVCALNDLGEGDLTDVMEVVPALLPGPPNGLTATIGKGSIMLTWGAPGNDGGVPLLGYNIYRSVNTLDWALVATTNNVTSYLDDNITNNLLYGYKVCAVNGVGEGEGSTVDGLSMRPDIYTSEGSSDEGGSMAWVLFVIIISALALISILIVLGIILINIRTRTRGNTPHFDPTLFEDQQ